MARAFAYADLIRRGEARPPPIAEGSPTPSSWPRRV